MILIRFGLVGALNSALTLLVFAALNGLLSDHRLAGLVAVPICVLISHATMGRLVFSGAGLHTLPAFVLAYAVLGALNAAIVAKTVDSGYAPLTGQIVALPFIAILSFLANRFIVFRRGQ